MTAKPTLHVVAAVLVNPEGQLLLATRPSGKDLQDKWEFPGGKPEAGESEPETLSRELFEELSLKIAPEFLVRLPITIEYEFPKFFVHIPLYEARIPHDAPKAAERQKWQWVAIEDFTKFDILPGITSVLPALKARYAEAPQLPLMQVASGVLISPEGLVLAASRPEGKVYAGLWEFPGGKLEKGETHQQALARELREELGLVIEPADFMPLTFMSYASPELERHILIEVFTCRRWQGEATPHEGQNCRWLSPNQLGEVNFLPSNAPILPYVRRAAGPGLK